MFNTTGRYCVSSSWLPILVALARQHCGVSGSFAKRIELDVGLFRVILSPKYLNGDQVTGLVS